MNLYFKTICHTCIRLYLQGPLSGLKTPYCSRVHKYFVSASLFFTQSFFGKKKSFAGSMLCVRMPETLYMDTDPVDYEIAERFQNTLYHQFDIEVRSEI